MRQQYSLDNRFCRKPGNDTFQDKTINLVPIISHYLSALFVFLLSVRIPYLKILKLFTATYHKEEMCMAIEIIGI